jgi:hypothetical protein
MLGKLIAYSWTVKRAMIICKSVRNVTNLAHLEVVSTYQKFGGCLKLRA